MEMEKDGTLVPSEMIRSLVQDGGVDPYPGFSPTCIKIEYAETNLLHGKPA